MALDDAGLKIQDMEALYCGNLGQANAMVGQRILQQIGQTGIPVVNCANACATGATAFREGWMAIKAGVYDLVLAVGVEQMGKRPARRRRRRRRASRRKACSARARCRRCSPRPAWSTRASTARPSSSSRRSR